MVNCGDFDSASLETILILEPFLFSSDAFHVEINPFSPPDCP